MHDAQRFSTRARWGAALLGALAFCAGVHVAQAGMPAAEPSTESAVHDTRITLDLTPAERARFLAGMREMLGSVQGIVQGIGSDDRELIAKSAQASGNRMARATPEAERQKLPAGFKALGAPTHLLFEEIAVRAETDDMASLTRLMGKTMNQCMACHATYKLR
jgi:hypothetical protein